jgi:agmatine/peptidylarginine deiminase
MRRCRGLCFAESRGREDGRMLVGAVLWIAGATPGEECCLEPACVEPSIVVASSPDPQRRMRGDFEAPDAVVIVDSPSWPLATKALLRAIEPRVPTIVLERDDNDDLSFDVYSRETDDGIVVDVRLDSGWVRDYGPLQVRSPDGIRWLNAGYYTHRAADDDLPHRLAAAVSADVDDLPLALEGGALIANGAGLCVSTTLSVARAEVDLDDKRYANAILDELGCRAWAIVPALDNDDTGHVDMFAQFLSPTRVMVASLPHERFPDDARRLDDAARMLRLAAHTLGRRLDIVRVPSAIDEHGRYLTYVNGTRLDGAFLVPSYATAEVHVERHAHSILKLALEGEDLLPILADELIVLGGAVHCATLGISLPPASRQ